MVATTTVGMLTIRRRRVWVVVIRPAGRGREGLLRSSSLIESGSRWLARVNKKVLSHVQVTVCAMWANIDCSRGFGFVVTAGPERALKIPKAVSGNTNVLMSLRVKSQRVVRKYERLEIQVQALLGSSFYVSSMSLEHFDTVRRFFLGDERQRTNVDRTDLQVRDARRYSAYGWKAFLL